ncbi:aggregation-promoting factor C-terminal-like domain-containing protein [Kineosporia babensis]|uniref:Lytic transglycosylase domain-containing protein n=1 Tax=Kineosporia babensis TaxID=499548 RepID=A0A9X1SWY6_9ACTN|nr:hypothetical protein [Kineosporia babensis]MCD5315281.1 hypothetical protein [Kineosporia babensis]
MEQLRRDPGRTVERFFVAPSTLRSISAFMLLGAVTGTAIAVAPHSGSSAAPSTTSVQASTLDLSGRTVPAALTSSFGGGSHGALSAGVTIANPSLIGTTYAASPLVGLHTSAQRRSAGQVAADQVLADAAAKQARKQKADAAARKKVAKTADTTKAKAQKARKAAIKQAARKTPGNSKAIAKEMVAKRGWASGQFGCLEKLWTKESGWNHTAQNPSSSAYGIPQSLPGSKMSSAGKDWRSNPSTQIKWGLGYIKDRYGNPCGAWAHSRSHGWY